MRIHWILISLFLIISFQACSKQQKSQKVQRNDIEMLYGPITLEQLYFDYPKWREIQSAYQSDTILVKKLSELDGHFEVKIFLATWCSDSRREVPAFFKILAEAKFKINTQMWALDRELKLDDNLPQEYDIQRVATFIFYRDGIELGRIEESPNALLLEDDIYRILSGSQK